MTDLPPTDRVSPITFLFLFFFLSHRTRPNIWKGRGAPTSAAESEKESLPYFLTTKKKKKGSPPLKLLKRRMSIYCPVLYCTAYNNINSGREALYAFRGWAPWDVMVVVVVGFSTPIGEDSDTDRWHLENTRSSSSSSTQQRDVLKEAQLAQLDQQFPLDNQVLLSLEEEGGRISKFFFNYQSRDTYQ